MLFILYADEVIGGKKCTEALHHCAVAKMPFLVAVVVGAGQSANELCVLRAGFVD